MSVIKFELKEDHIKLVKGLRFRMGESFDITASDEYGFNSPFGGSNLYEDIDVILNGKPENFDPMVDPEPLTEEQESEYSDLFNGLPNALEVVLTLGTFEVGHYKRKYHDRLGWKVYTPKQRT